MRLLIFSAILTALLGQAVARAQVDSAQWPFPGTLTLSCWLSGEYTYARSETQQNLDSMSTTLENLPLPIWSAGISGFTRNDVQQIDSNEWKLLSNSATLVLLLDTINHRIESFVLQYSGIADPGWEDLSFELRNLQYSRTMIGFADDDMNRHLASMSYDQQYEGADEEQSMTFCCPNGFEIFGQNLVPGFLLPHQINFGTLLQDSTRDTNITIINYSDSAVAILSFALNDPDSGFAFVDTNVHAIPAEDSEKITVRFTPKQLKSYSGEITIVTDEACTNTYTLNLNGAVIPSSVESGSENSNFTTSLVTENGRLTLELSSQFPSAQIDVFDILGHKCASMNKSLNGGENFVSLSDLIGTPGEYILRIQSGNAVRSLKCIKLQ